MANDKDVIFEVNAGQILAKLHLGCKQMFKNVLYYNSGIISEDNATPEKPGDCIFDLKNINSQYEVACALDKFYYIRNFTSEEKNKLKSKINTNDSNLSDDKFKKLKEDLILKIDAFSDDAKDKPEIVKDHEKFYADMKKNAFLYLKDYLENFCGKENASKLKEDELVSFYIDDKFDYKYDDYTITSAKNLDVLAKIEEDSVKKSLNEIDKFSNMDDVKKLMNSKQELEKLLRIDVDLAKIHLAFKTGFTVEIETM